jgi:putative SOS response-associated peptidase YedK
MCGRIAGDRDPDELAYRYQARLDLIDVDAWRVPRYNISPRNAILTLVLRDGKRVLTAARWGLVPHWAEDVSVGDRMINARAETVATLNSYREPFKKSRCVIPASYFYEWRKDGSAKVPHAIRRRDREPMSFAGLWSTWTDRGTGEVVESCTIITTTPNAVMEPLNNRMPVILDDGALDAWLEPDQDTAVLHALLVPCPDDVLTAYPVSTKVNNPRNQGPELIEPV